MLVYVRASIIYYDQTMTGMQATQQAKSTQGWCTLNKYRYKRGGEHFICFNDMFKRKLYGLLHLHFLSLVNDRFLCTHQSVQLIPWLFIYISTYIFFEVVIICKATGNIILSKTINIVKQKPQSLLHVTVFLYQQQVCQGHIFTSQF